MDLQAPIFPEDPPPPPGEPAFAEREKLLEYGYPAPYREVDGQQLHLTLFLPTGHQKGERRPIILCFPGSRWDRIHPSQFAPHCLNFRHRGAVAAVVEYRTQATGAESPLEGISDIQAALRWVQRFASELGLNGDRVGAIAGSAAGHALLSLAMREAEETDEVSAPQALGLFAPIVDVSKDSPFHHPALTASKNRKRHWNPVELVRKKVPPILMVHGGADRIVPVGPVERFEKLMRRKKNDCRLVIFEESDHSFFNANVNLGTYAQSLDLMDDFFVKQGVLDPKPADPSTGLSWE
ncbi:MAG: alpha/beta hydrolase [Verrucomicrobiota bacterium]